MNNWPSEHRFALALALVILLGAAGAYFFLVRPRALAVQESRGEYSSLLKELKEKVKDSGYPLDASRLKAHAASRKLVLDGTRNNPGLVARAKSVLEHATGMFSEQIRDEYTDLATFRQASSIVYRDELDQLTRELRGRKVFLDEEILGIGEDTTDIETFELLLKVWTVKKIVKILVEDHGLAIENRRLAGQADQPASALGGMFGQRGGRFASEITVLPTRSYVLDTSDKEPYVLEFPVRVRFQGPLPTVCEAIESLQSESSFLTANRLVLETENPNLMANRRPGSDGMVRTRNVIVTLEISSYFRPSAEAPKVQQLRDNPLPRGA